MTVELSLFVPGLLLMMFPADRLLSRVVRLRSFDCFQSLENSPRFRPWWWVPALWLDPLRGFFGTYCLKRSLALPDDRWSDIPMPAYAVFIGILCLGVLSQMFTRRVNDAVLAPIGFVAGIVLALTPWAVGAIGAVMALTGMFAFRRFHAFFSIGCAVIAFLGFVLGAGIRWLVPALVVLALPLAVSAFSGRGLEIPTRNSEGPPEVAA